jgi:hypothetical protein
MRLALPMASRAGATGRLTVREWGVPSGRQPGERVAGACVVSGSSAVWVPGSRNGPLTQQLLAAGFVLVDEEQRCNEVLNAGRDLIRDLLAGVPEVTGLTHYAVGTVGTAPERAQVPQRLLGEVYRAEISSMSFDSGRLTLEFYLPSWAANGVELCEAGPFGNGATAAAGSGTCYARGVVAPRPKTVQRAFTFTHELGW